MKRSRFSAVAFLVCLGGILALALAGCGGRSTSTSARFTPSMTVQVPGLVKLVERSQAGERVAIDVVLFGPEPSLDLSAFHFAIKNGNADLVKLVPQASYVEDALVADGGQTITIAVDGASDPTVVDVDVEKVGVGGGNGFTSMSAVVIELVFDVQGAGATTLTLVGAGNTPPEAIDSTDAPIASVTFDAASAGIAGVTTGGGRY